MVSVADNGSGIARDAAHHLRAVRAGGAYPRSFPGRPRPGPRAHQDPHRAARRHGVGAERRAGLPEHVHGTSAGGAGLGPSGRTTVLRRLGTPRPPPGGACSSSTITPTPPTCWRSRCRRRATGSRSRTTGRGRARTRGGGGSGARRSTSASGDGWLGARRPPAREPAARRAAPGRRDGLRAVRRPAREAPDLDAILHELEPPGGAGAATPS